jgi:hypothetical protein
MIHDTWTLNGIARYAETILQRMDGEAIVHLSSVLFAMSICVSGCIKGIEKNCWTIWHSQRRLELRTTTAPSALGERDGRVKCFQQQQPDGNQRTVQ